MRTGQLEKPPDPAKGRTGTIGFAKEVFREKRKTTHTIYQHNSFQYRDQNPIGLVQSIWRERNRDNGKPIPRYADSIVTMTLRLITLSFPVFLGCGNFTLQASSQPDALRKVFELSTNTSGITVPSSGRTGPCWGSSLVQRSRSRCMPHPYDSP